MAERTKWGTWLENALRKRGLKANHLATQAKLSRSTISQLMAGNIKSVSPALREQIALALGIATEEVPLPEDFIERSGSVPGSKFVPPPSYFAPGDLPPKKTLRFIDHGIPDHLLPRLAWMKGYFEPFNISLAIDERDQREYPGDQQRAMKFPSPDLPTLVSGPEEIFLDTEYPSAPVEGTFIARVNKYNGYALITRSDTTLTPVTSTRPDDKVIEFVNLMDRIAGRGARQSAAFVDGPARTFYKILWELYYDLENLPDPDETKGAESQHSASYQQSESGFQSAEDDASGGYKLSVMDRLHEIGNQRADFAVGTADAVALAYSSTKRAFSPKRYKVLVNFSDVDDIVSDLHLSSKFRRRLTARPWAADLKSSIEARTTTSSPGSAPKNGKESIESRVYERFQSNYRTKLDEIQLSNVWAINSPLTDSDECKALTCRIAGVAFRTVELLRDPDTQQLNANLEQLLSFLSERHGNASESSSDPSESYQKLTMPDFAEVWRDSYSLESYEEYCKWLIPDSDALPNGKSTSVQDSLRQVIVWMEEKRKEYEGLIEELTLFEPLPQAAEEHRMRAKHHYGIFSFWDAAQYAKKAKDVVLEQSDSSGGGSDD